MIGNRILHYNIIEQLGEGGMGEVYLAEDTRLHRKVALKFLQKSIREDEEARERLVREARAASALSHPNIVSIHAIEEADDEIFIVMEHVQGESLHDMVRMGAVTTELALDFSRQILAALSAAHAAGIVHRDIKSNNIIIAPGNQVKILDFGLAKAGGTVKVTRYGSSLGTPAYMSPEQIQGLDIDGRSDLFSFGVVLYEMLTGKLAFRGEHESAVTYSIVNMEPEPIAKYSDAPGYLQGVVDRLLAKRPEERYANAQEAVAALDHQGPVTERRARTQGGGNRRAIVVAVAAVIAITFAVVVTRDRQPTLPEIRVPAVPAVAELDQRKMLVVLPFENLGPTDQEYFADGVTEEITTHLARMNELGVISRTSAMKYKDSGKSLGEIGEELNVQYALEGTIRWDRSGDQNRVRVSAQLIRVGDDTHLWAETFDRVYEQIFELQTEIAQNVAEALNVTLLEPQRIAMRQHPTDNLEAYDYYLRGRDQFDRAVRPQDRERATVLIEHAVELDSTFSQAQAMLARIYANDHFAQLNEELPRLEQALKAAEMAKKFSGEQPHGHTAMGYYHYYGSRDYEKALEEFALGEEQEPNDADLLEAMAYVQRRQGNWDEAVALLERSVGLDPQSGDKQGSLVETYILMRRFADVDRLIAEMDEADERLEIQIYRALRLMLDPGDSRAARDIITAARKRFGDIPQLISLQAQFDIAARDFEAGLTRLDGVSMENAWDDHLTRGICLAYLGRHDEATASFDSARTALAVRLEETPDDANVVGTYALALAGLGRHQEAIKYANLATEIMPLSRDAVAGTDAIRSRAIVYSLAGNHEKAVDDLAFLLSVPSFITRPLLRSHPVYDALRGNERFEQLVANPTP